MARIFLCHASEDKTAVRDVYHRLAAIDGFEPWLDEEDLLPGQIWEAEIPRALKESEFILIFFSQNSVAKRGYVQREMKMALDAWQEVPGNTIHTIPIRLDECEIPEEFRRYQRADLLNRRGFDRLVRALHLGLEQRGESPPEPQPISPSPAVPSQPDTPTASSAYTQTVIEPASFPQTFTNSIGMEFILIPAGTFMMGSLDSDPHALSDEKPAHQVMTSQPFHLGKYPVTQLQWHAVMGTNPSHFKGEDRPVENVLWEDAQDFMHKLNEREGVSHYRLPTEAQWEYACRAGSNTVYHFGNDASQLGDYAWYSDNTGGQTHPVGQKKPNAWGLYDMHGNVWEWVADGKRNYATHAVTDPKGPTEAGARRVIRGGCWSSVALDARSALRFRYLPGLRDDSLGFRCLSSGVSK